MTAWVPKRSSHLKRCPEETIKFRYFAMLFRTVVGWKTLPHSVVCSQQCGNAWELARQARSWVSLWMYLTQKLWARGTDCRICSSQPCRWSCCMFRLEEPARSTVPHFISMVQWFMLSNLVHTHQCFEQHILGGIWKDGEELPIHVEKQSCVSVTSII